MPQMIHSQGNCPLRNGWTLAFAIILKPAKWQSLRKLDELVSKFLDFFLALTANKGLTYLMPGQIVIKLWAGSQLRPLGLF